MVERWAIVINGVVENVCLWDGIEFSAENPTAWRPPEGATMINVQNTFCGPGWLWDGVQFSPPPIIQDNVPSDQIIDTP